jgi:hypothetical protein
MSIHGDKGDSEGSGDSGESDGSGDSGESEGSGDSGESAEQKKRRAKSAHTTPQLHLITTDL